MVVAFGAFEGKPQNAFAQRIGSVADIGRPVFLIDHAAFLRDRMIAVEAGGKYGLHISVRDQIACDLQGDEVVVGHIGAKCMDHPIAPWPHTAVAVVLISMRIGIAGHIEPQLGHVLCVSLRRQ